MSDGKTSMLDALEPGDLTGAPEQQRTIEFAGKTFNMVAYVGGKEGGCMLVSAGPADAIEPSDVVSRFLLAAANLLAIGGDYSKITPAAMAEIGASMFRTHFHSVHKRHMAMLANRKTN